MPLDFSPLRNALAEVLEAFALDAGSVLAKLELRDA